MSRWNNYIERLDEKVSKKEIDEALKNDNILIGCEFEFKVEDDLTTGYQDVVELYQRAYDEVDDYNKSVYQYRDEIDDYIQDTRDIKRKRDKYQDRVDELTDAISDVEESTEQYQDRISDLMDAINEFENEIEDLETELDELDDKDGSHIKNQIRSKKDAIKNIKVDIMRTEKDIDKNNRNEEKWKDEIEEKESEIENFDDDIRYRENEGIYEEIEVPYLDEYSAPNYFEYMTEWVGYGKRDLYVEPGEEVDYPLEWESNGFENFEDAVENTGILNTAPFKSYRIGDYGSYSPKPGDRDWSIEDDSSLGEYGIEIKNPPMELPKFITKTLPEMFKWIGDIGETDGDCGFHCHMSVKNPQLELDYVKLILFTDEGWIYNAFTERAHNHYNKSVKNKLKTDNVITRKDIYDLFHKKKLIIKANMMSSHYDAIREIDPAKGHVEFRYMGGSNYHKKLKDVVATIGTYAHNLALATDPNYKRKEYILKLQRVFNKMELFYLERKSEILQVCRDKRTDWGMTMEDESVIRKQTKETNTRISRLSSIYKLDSQTTRQLQSNTGFMKSIMSEALYSITKPVSMSMREGLRNHYPTYKIKDWYKEN